MTKCITIGCLVSADQEGWHEGPCNFMAPKRDPHAEEQIRAAKEPPTALLAEVDQMLEAVDKPCPRRDCWLPNGHPGLCIDRLGQKLEPAPPLERYRAGDGPVPSITWIADFVPTDARDAMLRQKSIGELIESAAAKLDAAKPEAPPVVSLGGADRDAWQAFAAVCAALEDHARAGAKLQADYRAALERLSIVAARSVRGA